MFSKLHERLGTAGLVVAVVALVVALAGTALAAIPGLNSKQKQQVTAIAKKYAGKEGPQGPAGSPGLAGSAGSEGKQGPEGKRGPTGEEGAQGLPGKNGSGVVATSIAGSPGEECEGVGGVEVEVEGSGTPEYVCNGKDGEKGEKGETGFTKTLPSGASEVGTWAESPEEGGGEEFGVLAPISFNIPLANSLNASHAIAHAKGYNGEDGIGTEHENCPGKASNPKAKAGFLCVYMGGFFPVASSIELVGDPEEAGFGAGGAGRMGAYLFLTAASKTYTYGTWAVTAP
jgi:hypothetical protein